MKETIVFLSIVFGGLVLWFAMRREKPPRYRKKTVLTSGELEFFHRLQQALPECLICPHVAMSALIEPVGSGIARQVASSHIEGKRVGYAVFNVDMQLEAVVELDHRSRRSRKDRARDAYFASAGIRTVRFRTKHLPSDVNIRSSIYAREPQQFDTRQWRNDSAAGIEFKRQQSPWRNTLNAEV